MAPPAFYTLSGHAAPDQHIESREDAVRAGRTPFGGTSWSPPSTHDLSRIGWHMKDLECLAKNVETAVSSSFPNQAGSRYRSVNVGMMYWEVDTLGVESELSTLRDVFERQYGFNVETWLIPATEKSHNSLTQKALNFIDNFDSKDNLFILYYAGHGLINEHRQSTWACSGDLDSPTVDWSHIQGLFERSKSDVVVLLDCCAAASSAPRRGNALMETLVACGFETQAPPPGENSFTHSLIEVLEEWQNVPSFSITMLHSEVLRVLMQRRKEKFTNGMKLEWRSTPVHISNSIDPKAPSIELCRRGLLCPTDLPSNSSISFDGTALSPTGAASSTTYEDLMDLYHDEFDQQLETNGGTTATQIPNSWLEENDTVPAATSTLKVPHMLVSIALDQDESLPNGEACRRWLSAFPGLAKHVKVEAVFDSYSTVLIMSIPVVIWNMLPDHPACQPITYVTSINLLHDPKNRASDSNTDLSVGTKEISSVHADSFTSASNDSELRSLAPQTSLTSDLSSSNATQTPAPKSFENDHSEIAVDQMSYTHNFEEIRTSISIQGYEESQDKGDKTTTSMANQSQARKEKKLPSWIPHLSKSTRTFANDETSTSLDNLASVGHTNADPLGGLPTEQKPYRAAGSRSVTKLLRLESGGNGYDDYESMFVEGFILDKVGQLEGRSQGGIIPSEWLNLGKWHDPSTPPPEEFWRTLIADRDPNGRNVPKFYATVCSQALRQGVKGGPINTDNIISHSGSSVVTDFTRRVQSVICNRKLIRTQRGRYLGLVPEATRKEDLVCILYGCTVPVVLRRHEKTPEQMEQQRLARREQDMNRAATKIQAYWRRKQARRTEEKQHELEKENSARNASNCPASRTTPTGKLRQNTEDRVLAAPESSNSLKRQRTRPSCRECHRPFEKPLSRKAMLSHHEPYKMAEPDPAYYEFIGECYIHGMMNGEAITIKGKKTAEDAVSEDSMKTVVFELR